MKCDICKEKIEETFLNKLKGTMIKVDKKKKYICQNCQKAYSNEEVKEKLV